MFGLSLGRMGNLGWRGKFASSSLNLNFVSSSQVLDPRITFTRTSNATVTGPDGAIGYAPHNLLTYSEQFDNAVWGKNNSTVTANAATAPDGTATADYMVRASTVASVTLQRTGLGITGVQTHTASIYAKAATAGNNLGLRLQGTFPSRADVVVNLLTGAVLFSAAVNFTLVGTAVSNAGNGWYRISITATSDSTGIDRFITGPTAVANGSWESSSTILSDAYIWGAQLNVGALQPYYPTTVKNLLGYTQEFDNVAWAKANSSVTPNVTTAPDGSLSADLFSGNGVGASYLYAPYSATAGTPFRLSCYVKNFNISGSATVWLRDFTDAGLAAFNLTTGTVGTTTGTASDANIVPVGDGWFQVSAKFTPTVSGTHNISPVHIAVGNTTTGFYAWGAQLSDSASLDPYVYNPGTAPAAAAYYGPRFDYDPVTLQPKGLLLEEQRTNSIRNNTMQGAVVGTPGTLPTNWSGSTTGNGVTREIVGTGVDGGVNYIDLRVYGTPLSSLFFGIRFDAVNNIAAANAQTWSSSVYTKLVGGSLTNVSTIKHVIQYSDSTSAGLTYTTVNITPTAQPLISQRLFATGAATNASTTYVINFLQIEANAGSAIDITLRIGLPQLEQGAFATSVIPTTTAAATRAADVAVMQGANFSSWYRQDEGTLYGDFDIPPGLAAFPTAIGTVSDGTTNNQATIYAHTSGVFTNVRVGGVVQGDVGVVFSPVVDAPTKFAISLATNNSVGARAGVLGFVDSAITLPVVNQLRIGAGATGSNAGNTHIRRIAYFPRRLSNSELQAITA